MAEAVRVLPCELGLVRANELLAHERQEPRHLGLAVGECPDSALVEHVTLDRAALEDRPLGGVELVESSRQQRLDGRGHADLVVP